MMQKQLQHHTNSMHLLSSNGFHCHCGTLSSQLELTSFLQKAAQSSLYIIGFQRPGNLSTSSPRGWLSMPLIHISIGMHSSENKINNNDVQVRHRSW